MSDIDPTPIAVYLAGVNALAFAAFGADKGRAKRGEWRISESALMLFAAVGGSVGALAGMRAFRHKTKKPLFRIGVPVLLAIHLAVCLAIAMA